MDEQLPDERTRQSQSDRPHARCYAHTGTQRTFCVHHASGNRTRKVTETRVGSDWIRAADTLYLDGFELSRTWTGTEGATLVDEIETVHLMDADSRLALAETQTAGTATTSPPSAKWRYQLDDLIGSACVEVGRDGSVVSYEEYHAYGTTALLIDTRGEGFRKRYRWSGKERDSESGLVYFGARYFAPWLGRWASADPAGVVDGNPYRVVRGNPVGLREVDGRQTSIAFMELITHGLNSPSLQAAAAEAGLLESRAPERNYSGMPNGPRSAPTEFDAHRTPRVPDRSTGGAVSEDATPSGRLRRVEVFTPFDDIQTLRFVNPGSIQLRVESGLSGLAAAVQDRLAPGDRLLSLRIVSHGSPGSVDLSPETPAGSGLLASELSLSSTSLEDGDPPPIQALTRLPWAEGATLELSSCYLAATPEGRRFMATVASELGVTVWGAAGEQDNMTGNLEGLLYGARPDGSVTPKVQLSTSPWWNQWQGP